jgi:hypothetical protein
MRTAIEARYDPTMRAVLTKGRELFFSARGTHPPDLEAHVRAASALRRLGDRLVVVQDDVNALAVLDTSTATLTPLLLPPGHEGVRMFDDLRGNKAWKMDLEACAALPDGRLVAFGSGSSRRRERIVVVSSARVASVQVVEAASLYERLRAEAAAHGSELNIEGAVVVQDDGLWLLQRGHGKGATSAWNALVKLRLGSFVDWLDHGAALPDIAAVVAVQLGSSRRGVPFGFTDAAVARDGRLGFLACAEDSPDVRTDGPVDGCRFGWLDLASGEAVSTEVLEEDGRPTRLKLEGIETQSGGPGLFDVVADLDRPDAPAMLANLRVA